jgi:hypothetical protein
MVNEDSSLSVARRIEHPEEPGFFLEESLLKSVLARS